MAWTTPKTWSVGDVLTAADLNTYVRDNTNALRPAFRKTTATAATDTTTETDLLNGEFTLAAGAMGTDGLLRLTAWGDWINSGTARVAQRWKVKIGSGPTTIFDTDAGSANLAAGGVRLGWRAVIECLNLGSASSQWWNFSLEMALNLSAGDPRAFVTGEGQYVLGYYTGIAEGGNSSAINTASSQAVIFSVINPWNASFETKLLGAVAEIR